MSAFLNKLLPLEFISLDVAMMLIAWAAFARFRWPAVAAFVLLWFCSMPVSSELLLRRIEAAYPRIEGGVSASGCGRGSRGIPSAVERVHVGVSRSFRRL
jgi:hypothetical protein